ncbi:MAG: ABC transporter permease subunit [Verrucomicrobiae bacterium]|nr:ABC transporter permease subunit [Verrucomicrobiae bacterium]NNJ42450.1 ABC transporter permease subunit [Akkermansiaceae bacterium]
MDKPSCRLTLRASGRKLTVLALLFFLAVCAWILGPMPERPPGSTEGFWAAALHPALTDQNQSLPDDATPFIIRILRELGTTLRYAFIAMSMAVPAGIILGFFSSTVWWPEGSQGRLMRLLLRPIHITVRFTITLMRSIHELIWAIFFLAALGHDPLTACVALALPFTGTLAKVFSEIIDEQSPEARDHVISSGASPVQAFLTTLIPQTLPDMATYTLYRFECALRSSAVLGFIGIETIGLSIRRSFENNFYNELWTELYLLLAMIVIVDILGAQLRKRLHQIPPRKQLVKLEGTPEENIKKLKRMAPRWKLTRLLLCSSVILTWIAWFPGMVQIDTESLTQESGPMNRMDRISSFLTQITPQPVHESGSWRDAIPWATELWQDNGHDALTNTLAMATAAIIISALAAWLFLPWASRALASAQPMDIFSGRLSKCRDLAWKLCGLVTRTFFIISRAIPEYIYAYLLIGLLGISAWPLVLALALHNFGILGRLWGEVVENQPPASARQLMHTGSSRLQCYMASYAPMSFNRFLMYLFYRWETCVREATILGMLGFASLGLQIHLARHLFRAYDEMLFYVLLGAAVIFIGDLVSVFLRRALTKA